MNYKTLRIIKRILLNIPLALGSLVMLAPLIWMVSSAISANTFIPLQSLFPTGEVTLVNFKEAWMFPAATTEGLTMGTFFLNTIIMTVCIVIGGLLFDSMAGYVIARKEFPGRTFFGFLALSTLMVPFYVTAIPQYIIVKELGWVNTLTALIVPSLASGMGIHLFRSHFRSVPIELEECAKLDGASDFRIFFSVMLPISKPIIGTMTTLKAMWSWNQFLWPLIVINNPKLYTIQQGLTFFQGQNVTQYGYLCAGMTLAILPLLIVFLVMQNFFIGGLTAGAVKG